MSFGAIKRAVVGQAALLLLVSAGSAAQANRASASMAGVAGVPLSQLETALRSKAETLAGSPGMRQSFVWFANERGLAPQNLRYSDYVMVRLIFEATRDAGFWNMHWTITNQPPNSDNIWRQWGNGAAPSSIKPTASEECDELSALLAFLVEREGVKSVGLFWPYPNHTVAVWVLQPAGKSAMRVVVPTSQIFLTEWDDFDTRKFDPWTQKKIYEYTRRDVPDTFTLPKPLFDFFVRQVDRYAGASDYTLLQLRYLREGVFLGWWTPQEAAQEALRRGAKLTSGPKEDLQAFQNFAADMEGRR